MAEGPTPGERLGLWGVMPRAVAGLDDKAALQWQVYWHHLIGGLALSGGIASLPVWVVWYAGDRKAAEAAWAAAVADGWWQEYPVVPHFPPVGHLSPAGVRYAQAQGWLRVRPHHWPAVTTAATAEACTLGALHGWQWHRTPDLAGTWRREAPAFEAAAPGLPRLWARAVAGGLSLLFWQDVWMWAFLDIRPRLLSWVTRWLSEMLTTLTAAGATPRSYLLVVSPWREAAWTEAVVHRVTAHLPLPLTLLPVDVGPVVAPWQAVVRHPVRAAARPSPRVHHPWHPVQWLLTHDATQSLHWAVPAPRKEEV